MLVMLRLESFRPGASSSIPSWFSMSHSRHRDSGQPIPALARRWRRPPDSIRLVPWPRTVPKLGLVVRDHGASLVVDMAAEGATADLKADLEWLGANDIAISGRRGVGHHPCT